MTSIHATWLRYLLNICVILFVKSFNIDIEHNYLEYFINGKQSQFGYTVSLVNNKEAPLIVGAPGDNEKRGSIFKCRVDKATCSKVIFDAGDGAGNARQTAGQHFGFSLYHVGKRVMACAPKFNTLYAGHISQPVGKCSVFDKDMKLSYTEIPCENKNKLLPEFGYCLAGTSITGMTVKNEEPIYFVGTPGARHLRGHIFAIYAEDGTDTWNPVNTNEVLFDFKPNSYIGYAVSAGNISGHASYGDVVGGAPRGYHMTGQALLYNLATNRKFFLKANITNPDKQLGSYFGGAVCVADLNGDKRSDVLIGAPYFSEIQDEGRVYVYVNKGDKIKGDWEYDGLKLSSYLQGDGSIGGRFGTTIVNIGDINRDGFTDIAVGAPGGERGAVFIYNCGLSGIRQAYSQVIYGSSIPGNPAGFGISIASGVDVDENSYNDLAIGAYLEGKAFIFKSRSIITLAAQQTTNVTGVPPEEKYINCYWKNIGYHCISLEIHLRYDGKGTPDTFGAEITMQLDTTTLVRKRAFLVNDKTNRLVPNLMKTIQLRKYITNSISVVVFVEISPDTDMLTPIKIVSSFKAQHNPNACGDKPCGILDHYGPKQATSEVSYKTRCGDDDICKPDLRVDSILSFHKNPGVKEIIYGVVYGLIINSTIYNSREPAYQAKLDTTIHSDFLVDRVELNGKSYPLWEISEIDGNTKKLLIPLANPIPENGSVNAVVRFSVSKTKPSVRKYTFAMEATSIGLEINPADNKKTIEVGTKIETCVGVHGDASPSYMMSKVAAKQLPEINATVGHIGIPVEYMFYVKNGGQLPVELLLAEVTMVTEKDGVKLICIASITVDDIPCQSKTTKSACKTILDNPKLYGIAEKTHADERSLNCKNAECETFRCNMKQIEQGKDASIKIMARVLNINFAKVKKSYFETNVDVSFTGKYKDIIVQRKGCNLTEQVTITVEVPIKQSAAKQVPIWIIILAAIGALLLLALIIFILRKKKFFERKKHTPEDEPLQEKEGNEEEE